MSAAAIARVTYSFGEIPIDRAASIAGWATDSSSRSVIVCIVA
jgi:hypothetical protein